MPNVNPPSGAALPGSRQQQIQGYASILDSQYPGNLSGTSETLGQAYIAYMNAHPNASAVATYNSVVGRLEAFRALGIALPGALSSFIAATGKATNQIGQGVGAGDAAVTNNTVGNLPAWLQGFLGGNGILRIAEGILGIGLILVAADKLLDKNNMILKTVKGVVK